MALFEQRKQHIPSSLLREKFGWPPFSILNTISWDWQRRRDEWENVIQDSTIGRDVKRNNATPVNTFSARGAGAKVPESISEFDPYLCELMYRWFSREGDNILDPFSGGCVRGIVASILNRTYDGIDLSFEQVKANREQYHRIKDRYLDIVRTAEWLCGDSDTVLDTLHTPVYNMVFTCPPYYNLEKYTKDPNDLSNLFSYEAFLHKYASILKKTSDCLVPDSFFVIVVSEIRASSDLCNSQYRGFVPDTIRILRDECFLHYYNEIILENAIGSLPIRAPKYFNQSRKIGRHHQNILVFYKGNLENIPEKFKKLSEEKI